MELHANEHASRSSRITEGEKVGRKKNGEEKGSKTLRKGNERESIIYYDVGDYKLIIRSQIEDLFSIQA